MGSLPESDQSGIILVDKPRGVTSHDLVAAVRRTVGIRRVGHAGTLDPMATGLLVIGLGQATRLLHILVQDRKTYRATIRLGQATKTDDADGDMLPLRPGSQELISALSKERVEEVIANTFTGQIEQVPNSFSAIKVHGRRAYDLARQGKVIKLEPRQICIDEFRLADYRPLTLKGEVCPQANHPDQDIRVVDLDVKVTCSSGTYIRALARDLGDLLGVGGHLTRLRRTRAGQFDLEDPSLKKGIVTGSVHPVMATDRTGQKVRRNQVVLDQSREEILTNSLSLVQAADLILPRIDVDEDDAARLAQGQFLPVHLDGPTAAIGQDRLGSYLVAILVPRTYSEARPNVVFHRHL